MAGEVMDPLSIQKPLSDKANKWTGLSDSIYREEEQQFSDVFIKLFPGFGTMN